MKMIGRQLYSTDQAVIVSLIVAALICALTLSCSQQPDATYHGHKVLARCAVPAHDVIFLSPDDVNSVGRETGNLPVQGAALTVTSTGPVLVALWPKDSKELHPSTEWLVGYEEVHNVCKLFTVDPKGR